MSGQDGVQALLIGPEHRSAGDFREAVAVEIDDVDIARTQRDAFFQNPRAFVDQRMPAVLRADKAALLQMWYAAGLPGNKNDSKPKLVA